MDSKISRRKILKYLAAAPAIAVVGCNSNSSTTTTAENKPPMGGKPPGNPPNGMGGKPPMGGPDYGSNVSRSASTCTSTASGAGNWVAGGTDLIKADFPPTSIFESSSTCNISLTEATTEGPCYFAVNTGEDISEGKEGLPMQLCLRLVDEDCNPIANRLIQVWHCDQDGIYSGDTEGSSDSSHFAGDFCTGSDEEAEASKYFRGQLTTDSEGRVNFKSCFPGWYAGRTLHIHFSVDAGEGKGVISQLCFPDEFVTEIFENHCAYNGRGDQDTPLSGGTDTVFPATGFEDFQVKYKENTDGTLLAYHTIMVQS